MTKESYFAYGSNMLSDRLLSRIQSAEVIGIAYIRDKSVIFNKRSTDGSGKANLLDSLNQTTWGVLYKFDSEELHILDGIEGGYERISVHVVQKGCKETISAWTYVSDKLTDTPVAYHWYKDLIVAGAKEHNLPEDYIIYLKTLPSKPDARVRANN